MRFLLISDTHKKLGVVNELVDGRLLELTL